MSKIKLLIFIMTLLSFIKYAQANLIEIKVKLQNEIITNLDIDDEKKYLFFLNPRLLELEELQINKIAIDSLINEIIKKKEVERIFSLDQNEKLLDVVENNLLLKKKIKNKEEFIQILNRQKLDYNNIKQKLLVEALWNQLIFKKYSENVVINREKLKTNILSQYNKNKKKFTYNLSEIFFAESIGENIKQRISDINKSISEIGFENTANIYSIASTAEKGGLIGWVNELQISSKIGIEIKKLDINQVTKPIKVQNGFIIIKLNDKKEFNQKINIDEQLKRLINNETNRQLNNFSTIYYKKLKKNIDIYEY